jgi:hypothetical protein
MEHSTNRAAACNPTPVFMEHRWGQRKHCRARVYLSAGAGISGAGSVRDVSSSGAFIETALHLPMHARVMINVRGNESATHEVDIAASVARVDNDGIGVEWYETPAGSICAILGCTTLCAALKLITD